MNNSPALDHIVKKITKKIATPSLYAQNLPRAEGEHCFWIMNGPVLSTLIDLRDQLLVITEDQFHHHVSLDHNDFANWVDQTLGVPALAKKMRAYRTRTSMHRVVELFLEKEYGI